MIDGLRVLDGFDLGVGRCTGLGAHQDAEREQDRRARSADVERQRGVADRRRRRALPALPDAYAAAFSGLYFGLILVLWLLVGRGLALELRHEVDDSLWRMACDTSSGCRSAALALVFGVALGNVVRGVPLGPTATSPAAVLDPQLVRAAGRLFGLVVLAAHGARFLADGGRRAGSARPAVGAGRCGGGSWRSLLGLAWPTYHVRHAMLTNFGDHRGGSSSRRSGWGRCSRRSSGSVAGRGGGPSADRRSSSWG
jgi:hypothetical protein